MKKVIIFCVIIFFFAKNTVAQVAINQNSANPNPSAMLDVSSTTKGLLVPRMYSNQIDMIVNPATGLLVFDINENEFVFFDGTTWLPVAQSVPDEVYMMITDRVPKWSGTELIDGQIVDNGAAVGIGSTTPNALLTVGQNLTFTGIDAVMTVNTSNNEQLLIGDASTNQGILLGKSGNEIQARSGINLTNNGNLILNQLGGNVGIGTNSPVSTIDMNGSVGMKIKSNQSAGTNSPDNTASIWRYTSGSGTISLPVASSATNRTYVIVNATGNACNISAYSDLFNANQTMIANGTALWLVSDGSNWVQIK